MNFRKILVAVFCLQICLGWAGVVPHAVVTAPLPDNIIVNKKARADAKQFLFSYDVVTPQKFSRVFIDTDHDAGTGFPQGGIGADYLIENDSIYKYVGPGWNWQKVKDLCDIPGNFKQWLLQRNEILENQCSGTIDYLYQVESDEGTSTALKMSLSYPKTEECTEGDGQKIAVPAYFRACTGEDCDWERLLQGAPTASAAVFNPNSGPGDSKSTSYAEQVVRSKAAGVNMLGYVHTLYGHRDMQIVKDEIDKYYDWYDVDGIFLDEGGRECDTVDYYQEIRQYIKNKGGKATSILNFGTRTFECHIESADVLVTYESDYDLYRTWQISGWEYKYPASRFQHLVYDVPEDKLQEVITKTRENHADWIYITSRHSWSFLPAYWDEEVRLASQK